jgi:hypothetical protein
MNENRPRRGFTKHSEAVYSEWLRTSQRAGEALSRAGDVSPALYALVQRALQLAFQAGRESIKQNLEKP